MNELLRDVRYALRTLWRSPAFTLAAILALCLAIGANTAVFSLIHTLLTLPIPIEQPDRVAFVFGANPEQGIQQGGLSPDDYLDYAEQLQSFEHLTASTFRPFNVVGTEEPVRVQGQEVTTNFFDMTGVRPAQGRGFLPEEGAADGRKVVVVSHGFWQQNLGGGDVLGETLRLDGQVYEIVGIAPEDFFFGNPNGVLWTPLALERGTTSRDQRTLFVAGRLRDGVDPRRAQVEAQGVARRIAETYPDTNEGWTAATPTVPENLRQGSQLVTVLFYSAITFVLLIACVNIANLLLARALAREREIALRASLGASRLRIVRQLLIESLVLAMSGGILGLGLGIAGLHMLRNALLPDPAVGFVARQMAVNPWVVLHALAISALAGLVFGVVPALQLSRPNLAATLKEGARGGDSRRRRWLRSGLVMGEVALALALLITAAALIRGFQRIYETDPGFDTGNLLTLQLGLPDHDYPETHQQVDFYRRLTAELGQLPGVEGATATTLMPLTAFPGPGTARAEIRGRETSERDRAPNVADAVVTPGYFETLGLEIERGRAFTAADREDAEPVALITHSFLEAFGVAEGAGNGGGLDLQIRVEAPGTDGEAPWRRVVGVVADHHTHAHSLRQPKPRPVVYLPHAQAPRPALTVALRTTTPPLELAEATRAAIWQIDPKLPIDQLQTLDAAVARIDTQNTVFLQILTGLALVALALAAIGIYGIITYSVNQRQREIGLRMALGAGVLQTLGIVVRQAATLTTAGLVAGVGIGWLLLRFMTNQLEGLAQSQAAGPATFFAVGAFFLFVALAASAVPASRAIRVDPVVALREE